MTANKEKTLEKLTDACKLGRNYVRKGDAVRVRPSEKGRADGFRANVRLIRLDDDGTPQYIDVFDQRNGACRTLPIGRIRRLAQSRVEKRDKR